MEKSSCVDLSNNLYYCTITCLIDLHFYHSENNKSVDLSNTLSEKRVYVSIKTVPLIPLQTHPLAETNSNSNRS